MVTGNIVRLSDAHSSLMKDLCWWQKEKPEDRQESLWSAYERLRTQHRARDGEFLKYLSLYCNRPISSLVASGHDYIDQDDRLVYNAVQVATDAYTAKIGKTRPKATFLTFNGNWGLRERSKSLEKFVSYVLAKNDFESLSVQVLNDSAIFGTGYFHPYKVGEDIKIERVYPGELFYETTETILGRKPSVIMRRRWMEKARLKYWLEAKLGRKLLSSEEEHIYQSEGPAERDLVTGADPTIDQAEVVEAWMLPVGKQAGKYCMITSKIELECKDWNYNYFPFVRVDHTKPTYRFHAIGVAERLRGIQSDLNLMLHRVQKAIHLMSSPKVFADAGTLALIQKQSWSNEVGEILPYAGRAPLVLSPRTVHPEVFQHIENTFDKALLMAGIDKTFAGGGAPNLDSSLAQRAHNNIQSERLNISQRAFELAVASIAEQVVDLGKECYKSNKKYTVVAQNDKYSIRSVPWKDVDMERDAYTIRVLPSSSLPDDLGSRIDTVLTLVGAKVFTLEQGKRLLDFADTEQELSLDRASEDYIDWVAMKLYRGEKVAVNSTQDLQLSVQKINAHLQRAMTMEDLPPSRVKGFRDYLVALKAEIDRSSAQQMPLADPTAAPVPGPDGNVMTQVGPNDGTIPV